VKPFWFLKTTVYLSVVLVEAFLNFIGFPHHLRLTNDFADVSRVAMVLALWLWNEAFAIHYTFHVGCIHSLLLWHLESLRELAPLSSGIEYLLVLLLDVSTSHEAILEIFEDKEVIGVLLEVAAGGDV